MLNKLILICYLIINLTINQRKKTCKHILDNVQNNFGVSLEISDSDRLWFFKKLKAPLVSFAFLLNAYRKGQFCPADGEDTGLGREARRATCERVATLFVTKSKTYLIKSNNINIIKRFTSNSGKAVKGTAEKCIGIGGKESKGIAPMTQKLNYRPTSPQQEISVKKATQTPQDEDNPKRVLPKFYSTDPQRIVHKENPLPRVDPAKRFQLTEKESVTQDAIAEETHKRLLKNALKPMTNPSKEKMSAIAEVQQNVTKSDEKKVQGTFPVMKKNLLVSSVEENFKGQINDTDILANDLPDILNGSIIPTPPLPPVSLNPTNPITASISFEKDFHQAYENRLKRDVVIREKLQILDSYLDKQNNRNQQATVIQNLKEHLELYKNIKISNKWTEEKNEYLKVLNKILTEFQQLEYVKALEITRDEEEFQQIKVLAHNLNELWANSILEHLSKVPLKDCRTLEQFKIEQERQRDAVTILNNYGHQLPELIFHEIVRRAGVLINNDAMYKDDFGNSILVKEGEGSSLHNRSYSTMAKKPEIYIKESFIKLNHIQVDEIFANLEKGNYFIAILTLDSNIKKNKIVDSGDEIHMNVVTSIKGSNGETIYLSVGCFTSNKDAGTIKLTDKQYVSKDEKEQKEKEQRFRPSKQFMQLDQRDFVEYSEATLYAKSTNLNGQNVHEKIINAVKNNSISLRENPVRKPHIITREHVQQIALDMLEEKILLLTINITNYEEEIKNFSEKEKFQKNQKREAQYTNILKEKQEAVIRRNAPSEVQMLYKIRDDLVLEKQEIKKFNENLNNKYNKKQSNNEKAP